MRRSLVLPFLVLFALPVLAQRHRATAPPSPAGSPRISEEYGAGDVHYGPTFNANAVPRIAAGPEQSLVVWSASGGAQAARIDAAGQPIDTTPLLLEKLGQPAYPPDVVWSGDHYLTALTSYSNSGWVVRLVGISTEGRIDSQLDVMTLSQQPLSMSMARHASGELAVAYVTYTPEGKQSVGALIVSPRGEVLQQVSLGTFGLFQTTIRIAASPSGYFAVWSGGGAIVALHGASSQLITLPQGEYDVVWNGSDYFTARTEVASSGGTSTYSLAGLHVSAAGAVSSSSTIVSSPYAIELPALAWKNGEYLLVWKQQSGPPAAGQWGVFDVHAARVAADGTLLETSLLVAQTDWINKWSGRLDAPAVAVQGNRSIFVWSGQQPGSMVAGGNQARDLYAFVTSSATIPSAARVVSGAQRVSTKAAYESVLGLTAENGRARVFWSENPSFSWLDAQLQTASIDSAGRRSQPQSLPIPPSGLIARSGAGIVAVARENNAPYRVIATLVDSGGAALPPVPLVAPLDGTTASPLGLACGASECALVYSTIQGSAADTVKYYLQRFTPAGTLVGEAIDVPMGFSAISALGDQYLLVFKWPMQDHNLVVSRFADGKLSDITTLLAQTFTFSGAVATNGREWLVIWEDRSGSRAVLTAFRIDSSGNVLSKTAVTLEPGAYLTRFAATWDGKDWIVAWAKSGPQLLNDIQAARIAPDGTLLDAHPTGDGFGVAATTNDEYTLAIDSAGDGLTAVGYSRTTDDRVYGQTSRVFVRWIDNR